MKYLTRRFLIPLLALFAAASVFAQAAPAGTMVRLHTTQGPIDFRLLDSEAPVTVANFLAYTRGGDYNDVFFHRSAWLGQLEPAAPTPFIIQAGAFKWPSNTGCCNLAAGSPNLVASRGAIQNEFSPTRSNIRGTVAMAKVSNNPNSATNQWFINMANNAANLDNQNSGFTVFARVTAPGMVVADRISMFDRDHVHFLPPSPLNDLPLQNWHTGDGVFRSNFILMNSVTELAPNAGAIDRVFNYLEAAYTNYVGSQPTSTGLAYYFTYRYYADANSYLGEKDGRIWYYAPASMTSVYDLGTTESWLATAAANGY